MGESLYSSAVQRAAARPCVAHRDDLVPSPPMCPSQPRTRPAQEATASEPLQLWLMWPSKLRARGCVGMCLRTCLQACTSATHIARGVEDGVLYASITTTSIEANLKRAIIIQTKRAVGKWSTHAQMGTTQRHIELDGEIYLCSWPRKENALTDQHWQHLVHPKRE